MRKLNLALTTTLAIVVATTAANATPVFARKYKTSCVTCHTIFPKLTPFGEAFRRNGYRFPGIDSDAIKEEPVALGTDAQKKMFPQAVWPASVSPFPAFAIGFDGTATIHPDTGSSMGQADGGTVFAANDLVGEAHLWAAGNYDDKITYFTEVTFSPGNVDLERGAIYFNDLFGPKHAVNLIVGRGPSTLTSFGPHSSYLADTALPQISVSGLYGAQNTFQITDNHTGIEVNGAAGGRFAYAAGIVAGTTLALRNTANVYAHAGYKLGGMSLDGEDSGGSSQDLDHERSLTFDAFAFRSVSTYSDPMVAQMTAQDQAVVLGGALRGQLGRFELDVGGYFQTDDHVFVGAPATKTLAQWDEVSYLAYPWLAVAARVDFLQVLPDGGMAVNDVKITPGAAFLVRPNVRFTVTAPIERAYGAPVTDWTGAGNFAAPSSPTTKVGPEVEAILIGLFTAF